MGYSYGRNDKGRMVLSCDSCGTLGGVRKRICPERVLTDSLRGPRARLPYCYPSALCKACYARERTTLHATCKAGAAQSQARYDLVQARIDAGEMFPVTAWGAWHRGVPDGKVGVLFRGNQGDVYVLVNDADYFTHLTLNETPHEVWGGPVS